MQHAATRGKHPYYCSLGVFIIIHIYFVLLLVFVIIIITIIIVYCNVWQTSGSARPAGRTLQTLGLRILACIQFLSKMLD